MQYLLLVEKGDNGFGAYPPDLPAGAAADETREEAMALFQQATAFHKVLSTNVH
jgi:predicted RNase H-like HicB family nuclease